MVGRILLVNMNNGWIKIHRKLRDKGYYRKSQYVHLWLHLLLSANHETKEFMWNNNIIFIKEGQLLTGRKQLSHETGISPTTVERILNMLENEHQIGQQKTTKYRLITIINWTTYQKKDSKTDSKRTASGQQADTNKNDKNVRMKEENTSEQSSQVGELIDLFKEVNPSYKKLFANKTQRLACKRLLENNDFEKLKKIISFLTKSNTTEYMPVITTPVQLEDKFGQLAASWQKLKNKQPIIL